MFSNSLLSRTFSSRGIARATPTHTTTFRYSAVSFWNLVLVIGVLAINHDLPKIKAIWVHALILPISALLILSLPYMAVESLHQSVLNGQIKTAFQTLYKTRPSKFIAARDLYLIHVTSISRAKTQTHESSAFNFSPAQRPRDIPTLKTCLSNPILRRATISSVTIMLTRILIIPTEVDELYVSKTSRYSDRQLRMGLLTSARAFVFVCLLTALVNRVRRRRLLPILVLCELLVFSHADEYTPSHLLLSGFPTIIATICTMYAAEVFPSDYRGMIALLSCPPNPSQGALL